MKNVLVWIAANHLIAIRKQSLVQIMVGDKKLLNHLNGDPKKAASKIICATHAITRRNLGIWRLSFMKTHRCPIIHAVLSVNMRLVMHSNAITSPDAATAFI